MIFCFDVSTREIEMSNKSYMYVVQAYGIINWRID